MCASRTGLDKHKTWGYWDMSDAAQAPAKKPNIFSRVFGGLWKGLGFLQSLVGKILFVAIFVFLIGLMFAGDGQKPIKEGSALILSPTGSLVEQKTGVSGPSPASLLGGTPVETLVDDVIDTIHFAKDDDRIAAIVLSMDKMGGALPEKLERIAMAMDDFRESGKKIYVYGDSYGMASYYLASHADEIYMHPMGGVTIMGYGRYGTYMARLFDNIMVTTNVFRVGTFKSAVEPLIRNDMSDAAKEANMQYLGVLWRRYTEGVEEARGLDDGAIDSMINNIEALLRDANGDMAKMAEDLNLVDGLWYPDQFRSHMQEIIGETEDGNSYKNAGWRAFLTEKRGPMPNQKKKENVAIIYAVGSIVDGTAPSGTAGGDTIAAQIRRAYQDDSTKAIVLRVDSGGGSAFASEVIRRELAVAQEKGIPVVASMGSVAASGGYWISATADKVMAAPSTITGSIGIFGVIQTYERTADWAGVNVDGVGTTRIADGVNPLRPLNPVIADMIQQSIERGYRQFISLVAEGTGLDISRVDEIAQGRVWPGETAKELQLIDELGYLEDAIKAAAELAELEEGYGVVKIEDKPSDFQQFIQMLQGNAMAALGMEPKSQELPAAVKPIYEGLMEAEKYNDPNHAYLICEACLVAKEAR